MKGLILAFLLVVLTTNLLAVNPADLTNSYVPSGNIIGLMYGDFSTGEANRWVLSSYKLKSDPSPVSAYVLAGKDYVEQMVAFTITKGNHSGITTAISNTFNEGGSIKTLIYPDITLKNFGLGFEVPLVLGPHQGKETGFGVRGKFFDKVSLFATSRIDGSLPVVGASWVGNLIGIDASYSEALSQIRISKKIGKVLPEIRIRIPQKGGGAEVGGMILLFL